MYTSHIRQIIPFIITILFGVFVSCDNQPRSSVNNSSYNAYREPYQRYDTTGHIRKYFDNDWNVVHYKSKAIYYRDAYYVNGKICPDSIARDYWISGFPQFEGFIASEEPDILIGDGIWYYPDGSIEMRQFRDKQGRIQGKMTKYHPNGKVKEETYYKDGIPIGKYTCYHENGKKKQTGEYKDGKQHGTQYEYFENGKVQYQYTLSYGRLDGAAREYYENGRIKSKGTYSNGSKTGVWYYYDEMGQVSKIDHDAVIYQNQQRMSYTNNYRKKDSYQDLWDECEYYQDLLYENDISPNNELDYPMDYHELEDLRDELESQLQDEDIDY